MWYEGNSRYYYVDENDVVYIVWPDGAWSNTLMDAEVVAGLCKRIDKPVFGDKVLREIGK